MYPALFITPGIRQFAYDIDAERQRQIGKFGEQHHRDGTSSGNQSWADDARARCQEAADADALSWGAILYEEFAETMAETDPAKLRAELVQVAAVCAAWISDIDSRTPAAEQPAEPIVAYRTRGTRSPYCVTCARQEDEAQPLTAAEVTADTVCEFCGGQVLAVASKSLGAVIARHSAAEEQPGACGKCRQPFDPTDTRTRNAHQPGTAYCRRCVDRCHDSESADHRCVICA